jgi:hypothetical protein
MEGLDRLGWADGIAFKAYGRRVGIRVDDPGVLDSVVGLLPPGWTPAKAPTVDRLYSVIAGGRSRGRVRRYAMAYAESARIARTLDRDEMLRRLEMHLHLRVADEARQRVFVHAGVVGWRGGVIVIPGRSRSGKSTLVAALLEAGASYYSDEFAVLDRRGRVFPYPVPLAVRNGKNGPAVRTPAAALERPAPSRPAPMALVIVTRYRRGAQWRPRRLSPGKAALELLNHTVPARRAPTRVMDTLCQAVANAVVLKGVRGDAHETVERILSREWPEVHPATRPRRRATRGTRTTGGRR